VLIHRQKLWHNRRSVAFACAIAFVAIWAGYRFSFARVDYLHLRLPAPRFFTGLASVWAHNHAGHASYLWGRRSANGFWYYFPLPLAIKPPLAFLLLLIGNWTRAADFSLPRTSPRPALLFSAAVLLCASLSRINIGIRHILPIYVPLAVLAGCLAAQMYH